MSEPLQSSPSTPSLMSGSALEKVFRELLARADIQIDGNRPWDMRIHNPDTFSRILTKRSLGLGESYMDGWWDCDAIDELIFRLLQARAGDWSISRWVQALQVIGNRLRNRQSVERATEVAEKHYDLDNELFSLMLDETMAYSCGYWRNATTLHEAQIGKLDLICRKMGLEPGMRVLDIGCGWGSFVDHAARNYGVEIDGVTVSKEQAEFAQQRCAGLPVNIMLKDYREVEGRYDRIVSVGMFEHVGERNHRVFMEVCNRLLRDEGLVLLHTIGDAITTTNYDPWINKYIFPNGKVPSLKQVAAAAEGLLDIEDVHNFGPDYARTLKAWDANFSQHWDKLSRRYDQRFYRMWRYYLNSCAGAFRARNIHLWQFVMAKPGARQSTYTAPR